MSATIKEVLMDWLGINEFHNVRIDSKNKPYTDTLSCNEEFYLIAKTNIDDGTAIEIHLNILDKNKVLLKDVPLEGHVENEEVKVTLKIEDLAKANSLDLNAIKEINAVFHYEEEKYPTNTANVSRTLKSKELSDNGILNDIVEGKKKKAYKNTTPLMKGEEVKRIQSSLQKMKVKIGEDGVDGVFGNDGHNAVIIFQQNYKPSHNVHQYTWAEPDGIVGKNTLLAMDEALVSGWRYKKPTCFCNRDFTVDELKTILGVNNLFSASNCLLPSNQKTYEKLTLELNKTMKAYDINTCLRKAHFLAQCAHESDNFKTTSEYNGSRQGYAPYFGRGLIQLTHKVNYQKYADSKGEKLEFVQEKLSNNLEYTSDVSGWYWKNFSAWGDLNLDADNDDCLRVSLGINGGVNGYKDRKSKTKRIIKAMNILKCEKINDSKILGKYTYKTSNAKEKSWARKHKDLLEKYDD